MSLLYTMQSSMTGLVSASTPVELLVADVSGVSYAVSCMPPLDVNRFPWSSDSVVDDNGLITVTSDYLDVVMADMLAWQESIMGFGLDVYDLRAARIIAMTARAHIRAYVAKKIFFECDVAGDLVKVYYDTVASLEQKKNWHGDFIVPQMLREMRLVADDRLAYDLIDRGDKMEGALQVATTEILHRVLSVGELSDRIGLVARDVHVFELSHIVVMGAGSSTLADVGARSMSSMKPVIPLSVYRYVVSGGIKFVRDAPALAFLADVDHDGTWCLDKGGQTILNSIDEDRPCRIDNCVISLAVVSHMYLCVIGAVDDDRANGYCYLKLFPWYHRFVALQRLRLCPQVRQCRLLAGELKSTGWAGYDAVLTQVETAYYHVVEPGDMPDGALDSFIVAGGSSKDLVARAALSTLFTDKLVIQTAVNDALAVQENESETDTNAAERVVSPDVGNASIDDIVRSFFSDLGVTVADTGVKTVQFAAFDSVVNVQSSEWAGRGEARKDAERATLLEKRMQSGSVLSDGYCKVVVKRHDRKRSRPELHDERGRALQFDNMYAPVNIGEPTDWEVDDGLEIPGWTVYKIKISAGSNELVLTSPVSGDCDARLDWNGTDATVTVADKVSCPCDGTVMWFRRALPVRVTARKSLRVRCSVPLAGHAAGLGWDVKRFSMMCPTVALRSFDPVVPSTYVKVRLKTKWRGSVGASTYRARVSLAPTDVAFGIQFEVDEWMSIDGVDLRTLPAMVGIRSSDGHGITRVSMAEVTFMPDSQRKWVVVATSWQEGLMLTMSAYSVVKFSVVFVTNAHAFEVNYNKRRLDTPTAG